MDGGDLVGRRVLVVGSSAGIGRVVGLRLCEAGAHVAFAARRKDACEAAAKEAKGTAIGVRCDVTDESECVQAIADTVDGLGGLDDLVYSTGAISLVALAAADAQWWRRTFETNVMGAALVTRAALPHLQASRGSAVYFSSISSTGPAWPGIGVYTATKAALNRMIDTWRAEHPEIGFTKILVGPTAGGSTQGQMDPSAMEHMARWADMGICSGVQSTPDCIADAVKLVLTSASRIWDVAVEPRDPPRPWSAMSRADLAI
ncbi:MAG TPA: SDR family oxidoreductase [Acidimicrobiales bacterium]|nr:SDR family oxidoreductase [Acidimicrobiales bacterium]